MGHFRDLKNSLYRAFFRLFQYFMHNYAFSCNEIFFFHKNGEFILNHQNFSKFSLPAAPKTCHFSHFFNFGAFSAENGSLQAKMVLFGHWPPHIRSLVHAINPLNHNIRIEIEKRSSLWYGRGNVTKLKSITIAAL